MENYVTIKKNLITIKINFTPLIPKSIQNPCRLIHPPISLLDPHLYIKNMS